MARTKSDVFVSKLSPRINQASTRKTITRKAKKKLSTRSHKKRTERKSSEASDMSDVMREEGHRDSDRRMGRKGVERKGSDMSDRSERDRQSTDRSSVDRERKRGTQRGLRPFLDRNIFNDPFFTDPWQDLFNFSSFDDLLDRAKNTAQSAMKNASRLARNVDTSYPGSYTIKSFYRNVTGGTGRPETREIISHETTTNVDSKGRKFVENWKNFERGDQKKTIHSKMIDDKGIKEMRTHDMKSGDEYEHIDYRKMNEKDLHNFNSEFDRGIRNVKSSFPAISRFSSLLPSLDIPHSDFSSPRMLGESMHTSDATDRKYQSGQQMTDTRGSRTK